MDAALTVSGVVGTGLATSLDKFCF